MSRGRQRRCSIVRKAAYVDIAGFAQQEIRVRSGPDDNPILFLSGKEQDTAADDGDDAKNRR
jgi:hypothetical protein